MKIKSAISKPCITPEREIANSGNFQGYQTYSRGFLIQSTTTKCFDFHCVDLEW